MDRHPPRIALVGAAAISVLLGVLLGESLFAAARGWLAGEPARLQSVSIRGAQRVSLRDVAEATGVEPGARLTEIDVFSIEQNLAKHLWISNASALRLPTGRLLISVTERIARAVVAVSGEEGSFAVDATGTPFAPLEPGDLAMLPRLTASEDAVKDSADETLAFAIELAYRLPEFDLPLPSELFIAAGSDPVGFSLRLPDLEPRVVLGRDDFESRLAALARLLEAGLPQLTSSDSLDLRFADQAVLRGSPAPQGPAQAAAARGDATSSNARPTG
jgi:hypothetical protein